MSQRICVIGAGASGLAALKTCLEENLEADCYERLDSVGGLWRYREKDIFGVASVMKNTIIDSSKEMSAYTDFPPDAKYANFMHNTCVVEYFESYADTFKLWPHIHLEHHIESVVPNKDYDSTGKWVVTVKNKEGVTTSKVYDAVMIASGHHSVPYSPSFPGQEAFKGKVIHSRYYKDHQGYEKKRVLVVGMGNSAMDVAVELGRVADQVYLSTRRGGWVIPRAGKNGIPYDLPHSSRFHTFVFTKILPWNMTNSFFENLATARMDHDLYCLKPAHRILEQHPTVGDDLPNAILAGRVVICNDIERFTENGVIFKGSSKEVAVDAVILATGYVFQMPFLNKDIINVEKNEADLYLSVFPPQLKHPTMAIIGFIQPHGAIFCTSEMQSRWVTKVFKKELHLPSVDEMLREIDERRKLVKQTMVPTQRHTVDCNFVVYMNTMASLIGALPNLWRLAFTDPKLFLACAFGPCVPYQYRIHGPHAWSGARKAILTVPERVHVPLKTRTHKVSSSNRTPIAIVLMALVVFCLALSMFRYVA